MKHTPGPWKHYQAVVCNAPSVYVITVGKWGAPTLATVESEADARLIAAAPEMLATLKQILHECNGDGHFPLVGMVIDVIAKAENE